MNLRPILFLSALFLVSNLMPAQAAELAAPFSRIYSTSSTDSGWDFGQGFSAQGAMALDGDAARCTVLQVDGDASHLKLTYIGAALVNGQTYTLRFRAKADAPRLLQVFGDNSKHAAVGLNQVVHLTTDWTTFQTSWTAHDVLDSHNNAPQFWIGQNPGTVWLSDVSLTPGKSMPLPALAGPPSLPANVKSLVLRVFDKAAAVMRPDAGAMRVTVNNATGTSWHVQAALPDLPLQAGGTYTLTYRAKADSLRGMLVVAQATGDYRNIGLNQDEALTTQWQTYTRTFRTAAVEPKPDEIQFQLAKDAGTLWLTDLTLTGTGLQSVAPVTASAPELVPQEGEIMLRGLVTGTSLAQNRVFLSVTALRQFGGALVTLPAPRPKTIVVGGDAQILAPDQSPTTLDAARAGLIVVVVGKDSGVGKPLTARKMLFEVAP